MSVSRLSVDAAGVIEGLKLFRPVISCLSGVTWALRHTYADGLSSDRLIASREGENSGLISELCPCLLFYNGIRL